MASESVLFRSMPLGHYSLQTRIVMSPMSRFRADKQHVQLPYVKEYYSQRASPGSLIICENTAISPRAAGFENCPGIWTKDQIASWKEIADAVHAKGGIFFMQLCALGRPADPAVLRSESGSDHVSASAIPMSPDDTIPRALTTQEIDSFKQDFVQAAKNAIEAGFDGIEIHGAYGYLLDQFTQEVSNKREDAYGGSTENRSRFPLEVAQTIVEAVGADKVGYRMSPWSTFQGMGMKMNQITSQFTHLASELFKLNLAYLHIILDLGAGAETKSVIEDSSRHLLDSILDAWGHSRVVLLAGGFTPQSAMHAADDLYRGRTVATVFGRWFTSNPDLIYRIKNDISLSAYDRSTFYSGSEKGYIDQKYSDEFLRSVSSGTT